MDNRIIGLNEQIADLNDEKHLLEKKLDEQILKFKMLEDTLKHKGFKIHNTHVPNDRGSGYINTTLCDDRRVLVKEILNQEKKLFNKWLNNKFGEMVSGYWRKELTVNDAEEHLKKTNLIIAKKVVGGNYGD